MKRGAKKPRRGAKAPEPPVEPTFRIRAGAQVDPATGEEWYPVQAPESWKPTAIGDELVGSYMGVVTSSGTYGAYDQLVVRSDVGKVWLVSGVAVLRQASHACLTKGDRMLLRYHGTERIHVGGESRESEVHRMRVITMFLARST